MSHPAQKAKKRTQSRLATASRDRKVVTVRPYSYQPSRAELRAEVSIPATPDQLARAILKDVTVKFEK